MRILLFIFLFFSMDTLWAKQQLRIGVPDFLYQDVPLLKNTFKKAYEKLGFEVEFVQRPLTRSLMEVERGQLDGDLARFASAEKLFKIIRIDHPLANIGVSAYYRTQKYSDPTTDDLWSSKVGFLRGSAISRPQFNKIKNAFEVDSAEQLFRMLRSDKLDFIIINTAPSRHYTGISSFELQSGPIFHFIAPKHMKLKSELEKELKTILTDELKLKIQKEVDEATSPPVS